MAASQRQTVARRSAVARYEELGDFAATIIDPSSEPTSFGRPEITVETVSVDDFNVAGVTVLHARLTVTDLANPDLQLTIGHADLLSLEIAQIADFRRALELLTPGSFWDDLAPWSFATLFDPKDKDSLFQRYPKNHLQVVTIVRDVFVDPSFRGRQLGAWMLAEIAGRQHSSTTLFVGEPRTTDPDVDEDIYWKAVLKSTQLTTIYQSAVGGSPALKAARAELSQSLPERIEVSTAQIRERYDAGDRNLWPRSLVMPPLRFDHREAEEQRLWDELLRRSPGAAYVDSERSEEIRERLEEIREEKDEEFKEWERLNSPSDAPAGYRAKAGDDSALEEDDEENDEDEEDVEINDDDQAARASSFAAGDPRRDGQQRSDVRQISVVSWNVGHRITRKAIPVSMAEALVDLDADVVFLNEFVDGAPDRDRLRHQLREAGYDYFAISDAPPRHNQIFAASRLPIAVGDIAAPSMPDSHAETNFLHIRLADSDIELIGMRAPAYKSANERREYWSDLTATLQIYQNRALVLAGDLNSDPFKGLPAQVDSVAFPGAEMYRVVRPEGPWSFASLHDASKNSCIDHVLHSDRVHVGEVEYHYVAGGIDLAGPDSPHKGDHAALMFTAELL